MVPEAWKKNHVGKLCESIVPGRNKPKSFDGDIPWVTTPDIQGRYLPSPTQRNYVSEAAIKESGAKIVPKGSVVIAAVGELGLTAITTEPVVLNQQLHAFVCPEFLYNEYLAYWLETQKHYMESVASKTTIPYMNKANCESIPVAYPPFQEQKKISDIIRTWDCAIETVEKQIENASAQKKALMQQLLTGQKRFQEFLGQDWIELPLSELATIKMGSSPKSEYYNDQREGLPLIQGNADIANRLSAPRIFTSEITQTCSLGDILLSVRAPVGEIARSQHHACIGRGVAAIVAKPTADHDFLYQILLSHELRWSRYAQGSTFEAINSKDIKNARFFVPSDKDEQAIIGHVLRAADQELLRLTSIKSHLVSEKEALMQQLLTGKRRVAVGDDKEVGVA